jgi:polyisoprenyl-teichoic acid--peptidoglycan teichoic acid transferase
MNEIPNYISDSNISKGSDFSNQVKKEKGKKNKWKFLKLSAVAAFFGAIGYGGYVIASGFLGFSNSFQPNLDGGSIFLQGGSSSKSVNLVGEDDGRINFLMLGYGGKGNEGEYLTDTIIAGSFDPINKVVASINIPRDLAIEMPYGSCQTGTNKINTVYTFALNCAKREYPNDSKRAEAEANSVIKSTIGDILGIKVHYLIKANFDGFRDFVDTIGGVEVDVDRSFTGFYGLGSTKNGKCPQGAKPEYVFDGLYCPVDFEKGWQEMKGEEALMYARIRKVPNYMPHLLEDGDFARSARQQKVLMAIKEKVLSTDTLLNPNRIQELMSDFGDNIKFDLNFQEILKLIEYAKDVDTSSIETFVLSDGNFVYQDSIYGLGSVVLPRDPSYKEIQDFVSEILRRPLLQKEAATVTILNSTLQLGMAGQLQDILENTGFNVLQVGNYTEQLNRTLVYENLSSGKRITKTLLVQKLNDIVSGVSAKSPDMNFSFPEDMEMTDFTIIIGSDMVGEI